MTKVKDLHQKWMKSAEYRKAYEALKPEFELARARSYAARTRCSRNTGYIPGRSDGRRGLRLR